MRNRASLIDLNILVSSIPVSAPETRQGRVFAAAWAKADAACVARLKARRAEISAAWAEKERAEKKERIAAIQAAKDRAEARRAEARKVGAARLLKAEMERQEALARIEAGGLLDAMKGKISEPDGIRLTKELADMFAAFGEI